jgi:hypothetical protein
MTSAPIEVEDWLKHSRTFEPVMTAQVGAPADAVLQAIAFGLTSQEWKVKDVTPTGFRATYRDMVGGILGLITISDMDIIERTKMSVAATESADGTLLTITATGKTEDRRARKRGRLGLSAALQDLQRRGVPVTVTPWEKKSKRKKG